MTWPDIWTIGLVQLHIIEDDTIKWNKKPILDKLYHISLGLNGKSLIILPDNPNSLVLV